MFGRRTVTSLSCPMLIHRYRSFSSAVRSQLSHKILREARSTMTAGATTPGVPRATTSERRVSLCYASDKFLHIYLSPRAMQKKSKDSSIWGYSRGVGSVHLWLTPAQTCSYFFHDARRTTIARTHDDDTSRPSRSTAVRFRPMIRYRWRPRTTRPRRLLTVSQLSAVVSQASSSSEGLKGKSCAHWRLGRCDSCADLRPCGRRPPSRQHRRSNRGGKERATATCAICTESPGDGWNH